MSAGEGTDGLLEAVREELPLALGEALGPLIHVAVRAQMRWWRRAAIGGYLVLTLGLGYTIHDNRERSVRTDRALCVFRGDLEERARSGRQFLHDHPRGFAGIPASSIRVSLNGQERTIAALAGLHCPTP